MGMRIDKTRCHGQPAGINNLHRIFAIEVTQSHYCVPLHRNIRPVAGGPGTIKYIAIYNQPVIHTFPLLAVHNGFNLAQILFPTQIQFTFPVIDYKAEIAQEIDAQKPSAIQCGGIQAGNIEVG
jgi:hypothetical protein